MDEKRVTLQASSFASFVKLAESIVQDAVHSGPKQVVAVPSPWGGSQLKEVPVSFRAESAQLAKYTSAK
jgi:hypothetical protein